MVAKVERCDSCFDEVALRPFAYDQIGYILSLGKQSWHNLGDEMDHAFTLDQPADGQEYLASPDHSPRLSLQVTHTCRGELVSELQHIHAVRDHLAQGSRYAAPDALGAGVAADADDLVHALEASWYEPLVELEVIGHIKP